MLWTCILLPQLAMDGALRHQSDADSPLALLAGPPQRRVAIVCVAACSPAKECTRSRRLGFKPVLAAIFSTTCPPRKASIEDASEPYSEERS